MKINYLVSVLSATIIFSLAVPGAQANTNKFEIQAATEKSATKPNAAKPTADQKKNQKKKTVKKKKKSAVNSKPAQ